jgi:hypothetical protein
VGLCLLGQDVEDFNKTIAYADQDGRIKLFKVTAREFASSSIWENPLLPRDSQPPAEIVCREQACFAVKKSCKNYF